MRLSRRSFWLYSFALTLSSSTPLSTFAHAADLGPSPKPALGQSWTGFSLGVGGGVGSLNANVGANASRTDDVGCVGDTRDCTSGAVLREIEQGSSSSFKDLGATGGFFTLQGAYDYQFAPRWVAGAFVDADWSDIGADAKRTNNSSVTFFCPDTNNCEGQPNGSFATSNETIRTKISTDWNVSVGGRIGWLANPDTLLYFLAAYTHAELGDAQVKATIPDPSELIGVVLGGSPSSSPFPNSPTTLLMKLPELTRRVDPRRRRRGKNRRPLVNQA